MLLGEIEVRGQKLVFDNTNQPMDQLKELLIEGYKLVEPTKDRVGEYKAPLNFKANIEIDGVKYTKGIDVMNKLIELESLKGTDLLPGLVVAGAERLTGNTGLGSVGGYYTDEAPKAVGEENVPDVQSTGHYYARPELQSVFSAVLEIKSVEGVLKDDSIIKSFKNGTVRVGSEKLDADVALEAIRFHAEQHNIAEINGVLSMRLIDPEGDEIDGNPMFKFNNVAELQMLLYLIQGRSRASITEFVDANKLVSRLLNVRKQDLVGLVVKDATVVVTLDGNVAVFTVRNNVFSAEEITEWDMDIDLTKVDNFITWYDTIKVLHGAGAQVSVVGGAISCYDLDKDDIVEIESVAQLRAESNKRRQRIIDESEGELLELADQLEDMATRIREVVMPTSEEDAEEE
jgi:hypothetical protein